MKFKLGDIVEWSSHGSHWVRKKRGKIVKVIPPGVVATSRAFLDEIAKDIGKFDRCSLGYGPPRKHESYLVIGEETHKGMFKIFWPRVRSLRISE